MAEIDNGGKNGQSREREYYLGEELTIWYFDSWHSSLWICAIAKLPCCHKNGQGQEGSDIFPWAKAYLCFIQVISFGVVAASGFRVTGDPAKELTRWHYDPPEMVDSEWNEHLLFHKEPESAVTSRIQDLQEIIQRTSLSIQCRNCTQVKQCTKQIELLSSTIPPFIRDRIEKMRLNQIPLFSLI